MKLTIVDAMRLRNELKALVVGRYGAQILYGATKVDDVNMPTSGQVILFDEHLKKRVAVFQMLEELNARLTEHNQAKGIYKIVEALQNKKDILQVVNTAIPSSKPSTSYQFVNVGNERKKIEYVFTPFTAASVLKEQAKFLRQEIRSLQKELTTLDQTEIEVSFDENVIDDLQTAD